MKCHNALKSLTVPLSSLKRPLVPCSALQFPSNFVNVFLALQSSTFILQIASNNITSVPT